MTRLTISYPLAFRWTLAEAACRTSQGGSSHRPSQFLPVFANSSQLPPIRYKGRQCHANFGRFPSFFANLRRFLPIILLRKPRYYIDITIYFYEFDFLLLFRSRWTVSYPLATSCDGNPAVRLLSWTKGRRLRLAQK
jgi:hypothetical protein